MKKETWKTIINFVITVLTAIASSFCMMSCRSWRLEPGKGKKIWTGEGIEKMNPGKGKKIWTGEGIEKMNPVRAKSEPGEDKKNWLSHDNQSFLTLII